MNNEKLLTVFHVEPLTCNGYQMINIDFTSLFLTDHGHFEHNLIAKEAEIVEWCKRTNNSPNSTLYGPEFDLDVIEDFVIFKINMLSRTKSDMLARQLAAVTGEKHDLMQDIFRIGNLIRGELNTHPFAAKIYRALVKLGEKYSDLINSDNI